MTDQDHTDALRKAVASNIRAERARAEMTQKQLAAAMQQRGYRWHHQTVGVIEAGQQRVAADELLTLAEILGCPAEYLWRIPGGRDEPARAGALDLRPGRRIAGHLRQRSGNE